MLVKKLSKTGSCGEEKYIGRHCFESQEYAVKKYI